MLQVTQAAAVVLKQARERTGMAPNAGARLSRVKQSENSEQIIGLNFTQDPETGDETIEQQDLKLYVSSDLVEPLSERTLDVEATKEGLQLLFR
jgi:Fe-S cluster assembly iron-binding protein IscA